MKKTSRGRPTKPPERVKAQILQVRLEPSEKEGFDAAAELAGLPLSGWVRERLRLAARSELEGYGKPVSFLKKSETARRTLDPAGRFHYGRVAEWQGSRLITGSPGSSSKHQPGVGSIPAPAVLFCCFRFLLAYRKCLGRILLANMGIGQCWICCKSNANCLFCLLAGVCASNPTVNLLTTPLIVDNSHGLTPPVWLSTR